MDTMVRRNDESPEECDIVVIVSSLQRVAVAAFGVAQHAGARGQPDATGHTSWE
jgi:hypothetical protein